MPALSRKGGGNGGAHDIGVDDVDVVTLSPNPDAGWSGGGSGGGGGGGAAAAEAGGAGLVVERRESLYAVRSAPTRTGRPINEPTILSMNPPSYQLDLSSRLLAPDTL
jgi:hypothetical protein